MKAYHGASAINAARLIADGVNPERVLCVTDTPERAARYANAQATGEVDPDATELLPGAAVVELEIPETAWGGHGGAGASLDEVEAWVTEGKVVGVRYALTAYDAKLLELRPDRCSSHSGGPEFGLRKHVGCTLCAARVLRDFAGGVRV